MTLDTKIPVAHPALRNQVGGSHYRLLRLQPMEFSTRRGYDPCAHTILKYLTRFDLAGGAGKLDLEKARHTAALRQHLKLMWPHRPEAPGYTPGRYCALNVFSGRKATAICLLDAWVTTGIGEGEPLFNCINQMLWERYRA